MGFIQGPGILPDPLSGPLSGPVSGPLSGPFRVFCRSLILFVIDDPDLRPVSGTLRLDLSAVFQALQVSADRSFITVANAGKQGRGRDDFPAPLLRCVFPACQEKKPDPESDHCQLVCVFPAVYASIYFYKSVFHLLIPLERQVVAGLRCDVLADLVLRV